MSPGDVLLEGGIYKSLSSGIEYEEKRIFLANVFLVKFIFLLGMNCNQSLRSSLDFFRCEMM